jgi:hypothetical protein
MIIPTLNQINIGGCKKLVLIPTEMLSSFPPPDSIGIIDINYISFNNPFTMEDATTILFKTGDLKMSINPLFVKGDDMCETIISGTIPKDNPEYLSQLELLKNKPCVAIVHTNNDYQDGTTVMLIVGTIEEGAKYQPTLRTPGDDAAALNSYSFEVKVTRKNNPSFGFFS